MKHQEEWHEDEVKECLSTSHEEESNLWEEFAAIMGEWQRNSGSVETQHEEVSKEEVSNYVMEKEDEAECVYEKVKNFDYVYDKVEEI